MANLFCLGVMSCFPFVELVVSARLKRKIILFIKSMEVPVLLNIGIQCFSLFRDLPESIRYYCKSNNLSVLHIVYFYVFKFFYPVKKNNRNTQQIVRESD